MTIKEMASQTLVSESFMKKVIRVNKLGYGDKMKSGEMTVEEALRDAQEKGLINPLPKTTAQKFKECQKELKDLQNYVDFLEQALVELHGEEFLQKYRAACENEIKQLHH